MANHLGGFSDLGSHSPPIGLVNEQLSAPNQDYVAHLTDFATRWGCLIGSDGGRIHLPTRQFGKVSEKERPAPSGIVRIVTIVSILTGEGGFQQAPNIVSHRQIPKIPTRKGVVSGGQARKRLSLPGRFVNYSP